MRFSIFKGLSSLMDRFFSIPGTLPEVGVAGESSINGRLMDLDQANSELPHSTESLDWAGVTLPLSVADKGFMIMGGDSNVRSAIIRNLISSAFSTQTGQNNSPRAVFFDSKRSWYSVLANMGLESQMIVLNPFDERGVKWDIASDIQSPSSAYRFSETLFPDSSETLARIVTSGVIEALITIAGNRWQFRDLVLFLKSFTATKVLLQQCDSTKHLIDEWFLDADSIQSVVDSVESSWPFLSEIAVAWSAPEKVNTFSFSAWGTEKPAILLLGDHPRGRPFMGRLNTFFFDHLSDQIVGRGEQEARFHGNTWIILDDLCRCGKLGRLQELLARSSSCGVCGILGIESVVPLRSIYGDAGGDDLISSCSHRLFLRANDPLTAAVAEDFFPTVTASDMMGLAVSSPQEEIQGVARSTAITRPYRVRLSPEELSQVSADIYTPDLTECQPLPLAGWNESDLQRLSLSGLQSILLPSSGRELSLDKLPRKFLMELDENE